MKNKRKFVIIGVVLLLIAMAFEAASFYVIELPVEIAGVCAVLIVFSGFTCIGIAEAMFIRAKVVPKFLKYVFWFQWFVAGTVLLLMLIYMLCGGELVITRVD